MLSLLVAHPEYGEGQRQWTHRDVALWIECLRSKGVLIASAREFVQSADGKQPVTVEQLSQIFEPGAMASLEAAFDGDWRALLEWWRAPVAPSILHPEDKRRT
jgi:hypothetical protein